MRLGVALRDLLPPDRTRAALPVRAMVALAALADRLGYDSLWLPEGRGREAFAQLGAMATMTRQARLATGIMPVFSRPPALAAMGLATLDDLSGGRLIFGLGAGHPAISERGYGLPFRHPVTAVREFVEIVRRAMRGETVRYEGRVFRVESFALESLPARPVPVFIAALRRRMLALAGEIGDGVLLNWSTPERARAASEVVRAAAQAAGRRPEEVTVACFIRVCVTARPEPAREALRRIIASYAGLPAYRAMWAEAGFAAEMAEAEAAAPAGAAALRDAVSDRMVDALGL
ncbi:MAG TPA: LLM class flavin-dependent oxidoreductase, partial [bacterium]|nr:LLM class flavin-dependent oxidoreductase [bacterium]